MLLSRILIFIQNKPRESPALIIIECFYRHRQKATSEYINIMFKGNSEVQKSHVLEEKTRSESSESNVLQEVFRASKLSKTEMPPVRTVQEVRQSTFLAGIWAKDENCNWRDFCRDIKAVSYRCNFKANNCVYTGPKEIAVFLNLLLKESIGQSPVRILKSETTVNPR